ncbi:hypothetical protein AMS59_19420 [Lysinibacillus sp. FJAT-14745]|nr:hypothetical protein AMS59_19420 [Lysinibacillus sp. FJAT-14745]
MLFLAVDVQLPTEIEELWLRTLHPVMPAAVVKPPVAPLDFLYLLPMRFKPYSQTLKGPPW